jgi:hypothetical protein
MHMINKPITKPHSFSYATGLISGTTVSLYGRICKSLVAVQALSTETPLCRANRCKNLRGEF